LARLHLLVAVKVDHLTRQQQPQVVRVVAVPVEQKQSIMLAVQVTHQAQAHRKAILVEHLLVLKLRLIKQAVAVAVQVQQHLTHQVLHHQRAVREHRQALTEALQPAQAAVVVPA
jgi:3-polyprenyl-4-hydroxybenzoate decarboxylase